MAAASVNTELDIDAADLLPSVLAKKRRKFFDVEISFEGIF